MRKPAQGEGDRSFTGARFEPTLLALSFFPPGCKTTGGSIEAAVLGEASKPPGQRHDASTRFPPRRMPGVGTRQVRPNKHRSFRDHGVLIGGPPRRTQPPTFASMLSSEPTVTPSSR